MRLLLIAGWAGLLMFVLWEFISAGSLPGKYANLSPVVFRIADVLIGALALLSIWYFLKK